MSLSSDRSMSVITVRDLTKRYGAFTAVNRISFEVRQGEVFAFLGPNGSGKSTTMRMLCAIVQPTSGSGRVLGYDIVREGEQIKRHIGYMSQRFSLYEDLTVRENLEFYAGIYGVPGKVRHQRLADLTAMAGLLGRERQLAGQLSGGWKQRLALSCSIVHQPRLLFLDEPTAGVDPISRREFWTMIYGLANEGVTIFVTTHYLDEAEHATRVAMLHAGTIRALGTPAELKRSALQGVLHSLRCDQPLTALALLRTGPGVREVALYGEALHVLTDDVSTADALVPWLASHNVRVAELTRIAPTIEDVFVSLMSEPSVPTHLQELGD